MTGKGFFSLRDMMARDLPQLDVVLSELPEYREVRFSLLCKITGKNFQFMVPDDKYGLEVAERRYEEARKEILMERGKAYSTTYTSPSSGALGGYATYTPSKWADSTINLDEILDTYEDMINNKKKDKMKAIIPKKKYEENEDYGIF